MVKPAQLLQDLGMIRVAIQDLLIGAFCGLKILLLLMDMANLEKNVRLIERWRRVVCYPTKALQALAILVLLLVYDTKAEVDLIGFFEIRCHAHDL